uniref:Protein kinase domain-containing protein n=1 Tax=Panagrellus redivivus TaxID=6233 RepID=A0A7E4UMH9_PANRE
MSESNQRSSRREQEAEHGTQTREIFDSAQAAARRAAALQTPSNGTTTGMDITRTVERIRTQNPVEKVEQAHHLAMEDARFKEGHCVRSIHYGYKILKELAENAFGYLYEAEIVEGMKKVWLKTEPMSEDPDMKKFKVLKNELVVLQAMCRSPANETQHFSKLLDSGCTEKYKFLILEPLGENLYVITRLYLNSSFTKSTALRVSIQMLKAIVDLHTIGFIHRFLKPHVFAIGLGNAIKTVHLTDFSLCYAYREANGKVKRPRRKQKILGTLRYTSRHSHLNQELARRDDLESWLYLSIEFFHLNVLPWRGDQLSPSVLYKKQKLFDGDYPRVFKKAPAEYYTIMRYINGLKYSDAPDYAHIMAQLEPAKQSNNIDFSLPYDWENLIGGTKLPESAESTKPPPKAPSKSTEVHTAVVGSADVEPQPSNSPPPISGDSVRAVERFNAKAKKGVDDFIHVSLTDTGEHQGTIIQKDSPMRPTKVPNSNTDSKSKSVSTENQK